ncbi:serine hydrolase [Streptomyces sp. NPDC007083]|uniref:serine hydrolase n=1 Tax=Streptomyces sp. NPDC007083 TaxID=3156913 RepID=UPI0033F3C2DC
MASGEQQHQEASVAGESPDRSERERSSGETTGSGGSVARPDETAEKKPSPGSAGQNGAGATTTQDAAPSVIPSPAPPAGEPDSTTGADEPSGADEPAESDGSADGAARGADDDEVSPQDDSSAQGDTKDERLKSAVAAWVSGDSAPERTDSASDGADDAPGGTSGGGDRDAAGRAGEAGDGAPATDLPYRPKPEGASGAASGTDADKGADTAPAAPQDDAPTAMFGVLRRGGEAADKSDDATAADRAERLTSAFFGASKGAEDAADAGEAADTGAGDRSGTADGASENGGRAKAVDQPTAIFRAPGTKPGEGSGGSDGEAAEPGKQGKPGRAEQSGGKGSAAPAGAPDPRAWSGESDKADEAGRDSQDGKDRRADTADTAGKDGGKDGKDGGKARREGSAAGGTGAAESDAERTSQFVPLRSTDEPRTATTSAPPEAGAAAPAPGSPVSPPAPPASTTANPWAAAPAAPPAAGTSGTQAPASSPAESEPERTRQQPMPGSPEAAASGGGQPQPLDLLAQLTNSPPPPETPIRTFTRRVKIWTPLVLLLAVIFVVVQAVRPLPDPELSMTASETFTFKGSEPEMPWPSEGQAVIDVDGLGSFGSHGEQKPVPIASVAKVMTAYVILRDHPVKKGSKGEMIPVDQKAEDEAGLSAQNESTVKVQAGTKITQREALDAIMIASANNVARLLARWDAGSEKAFVKKMNAAAEDLGMTNSHYTDPSGLTASTVSTAADQVKLGKKVMESPLFREVVRQPSYQDTNGKNQSNWNRLVPVDGVVGIKTGTTTKAGGNLLFAAEKEIGGTRQLIIGAVLGQYKPSILDTVLAASKKLIDAGQDALTARKVVEKGQVVGYVDDQLGNRTPVVATKDVTAVGWPGLKVKLALTDSGKTIPHAAEPGAKVGSLTAGDGPGQVKVPVALQDDLTEPGFGDKLARVG